MSLEEILYCSRDDRYTYADKGDTPSHLDPIIPPTHEWMSQLLKGAVRDNEKLSP